MVFQKDNQHILLSRKRNKKKRIINALLSLNRNTSRLEDIRSIGTIGVIRRSSRIRVDHHTAVNNNNSLQRRIRDVGVEKEYKERGKSYLQGFNSSLFGNHVDEIYRTIRSYHEPITADGAITGHINPVSWKQWVYLASTYFDFGTDSIFLDVGSGMGHPVLSVESIYKTISIGIETDKEVWKQSNLIRKDLKFRSIFINQSILDVFDVSPCTHVYSFSVGMPENVILHIIALCAISKSVQILSLYSNKAEIASFLYTTGLLQKLDADDHHIIAFPVKMKNCQYTNYIVPMTDSRKELIRSILDQEISMISGTYNFTKHVRQKIQFRA